MTPFKAIQAMNKGYKYAFCNIKNNKAISLHKEWDIAWNKVKRTKGYHLSHLFQNDELITHDVISLYDIAFNNEGIN